MNQLTDNIIWHMMALVDENLMANLTEMERENGATILNL